MKRMPEHQRNEALCFSASAKNWAARSRLTSPLNAATFAAQDTVED